MTILGGVLKTVTLFIFMLLILAARSRLLDENYGFSGETGLWSKIPFLAGILGYDPLTHRLGQVLGILEGIPLFFWKEYRGN
jgi:hypothetical protein